MAIQNLMLGDCMEWMKSLPDGYYDLGICDPMYDLDTTFLCPGSEISTTGVKRNHIKQARVLSKLELVNQQYFDEVLRVSKNHIIWGENYFNWEQKPKGRIIWDKINDTSTFSNAEIASCSLIQGTRIFRYTWNGFIQHDMKNKEVRIHAFQKPVALYKWLLTNYAKAGQKIFDSHGGSFSHAIAAYDLGFDLDIIEIDPDYFRDGKERYDKHVLKCEEIKQLGFAKTELSKTNPTLF